MGIIREYFTQYTGMPIYFFYQGNNPEIGCDWIKKGIGFEVLKIEIEFEKEEDIATKIISVIDNQGCSKNDIVVIISETCFGIKNNFVTNTHKSKWLFYQYMNLFPKLIKAGIINLLAYNYEVVAILESQNEIEAVYNLLADTKSRRVFTNFLFFKFCCDIKLLNDIFEPKQYFVSDIFNFNSNEVFVDAGAHQGDTLLDFMNEVDNNFDKIYLFEPEISNFSKLEDYVSSLGFGDKILLFRTALYNKRTTLKMIPDGNCSELNDFGEQSVSAIDMDSVLSRTKVTFIKMDIEGAEIKALQGSVKLIKKHKPKLAICTYHSIEDLWLIPLMINSINPKYQIYLRHHDLVTPSETVCYAI